MTSYRIEVPADVARITHEHLRSKGRSHEEGVVLWTGTLEPLTITGAIVPAQETGPGRFRVALRERQQITRQLAGSNRMIVCQVHSHPETAFHSWIDDREAIPRRVGTYSLVIPEFGSRRHLLEQAALFQLDANGNWIETSAAIFKVGATPPPQSAERSTAHRHHRLMRWLIDTLKNFGHSRT